MDNRDKSWFEKEREISSKDRREQEPLTTQAREAVEDKWDQAKFAMTGSTQALSEQAKGKANEMMGNVPAGSGRDAGDFAQDKARDLKDSAKNFASDAK